MGDSLSRYFIQIWHHADLYRIEKDFSLTLVAASTFGPARRCQGPRTGHPHLHLAGPAAEHGHPVLAFLRVNGPGRRKGRLQFPVGLGHRGIHFLQDGHENFRGGGRGAVLQPDDAVVRLEFREVHRQVPRIPPVPAPGPPWATGSRPPHWAGGHGLFGHLDVIALDEGKLFEPIRVILDTTRPRR